HFLAPARVFVERAAFALEGRINGRRLPDIARKWRHVGLLRYGQLFDYLTFGVVGIGPLAQPNAGQIHLRSVLKLRDDPRGLTKARQQHAAGQRIQRARVAYAPDAGRLPHASHDVERGQAGWLVEVEDAVQSSAAGGRFFRMRLTSSA